MARWKLMAPHYLNTFAPTEWEHNEVVGGKNVRKRFVIPALLDPRDPGCWTNKWGNNKDNEEGEVIVCQPGRGEGRDIEILGDPTPDMIPLDDEARVISASFENHWSYKPDTAEQSFSTSLIDKFEELRSEIKPATVQVEGLSDILTIMAANQKALTELLHTAPNSARRG